MKASVLILVTIVSAIAAQVQAVVPVECVYTSIDVKAELEVHADCATIQDGVVTIMPEHLKRMSYSDRGLATVRINKQHFYVKRSGVLLPVISFDNWADYFSEGLTRSRVRGKIAFFDSDFKQVIAPIYDWAWPFKDGRALVCIGCSVDKPDPDGHISISGGRWGYINRQGAEVVPVRFSKEEIRKQ